MRGVPIRLSWKAQVLTLTAVLAGCSGPSSPTTAEAAAPPVEETKRTEVVAVVQPSRTDIARRLTLTGEFKAYQSVEIHARVAGYIRKMHVDVGDTVKAGATLAEIEVPELTNELQGAEATSQELEAEIARMERELERARTDAKLAEMLALRLESVQKREPGLIARHETEAATLQHESALVQVQAAEAAIAAARRRAAAAQANQARTETIMEFRRVTAPFGGVVTNRFADPGAIVRAVSSPTSQPIVRLAQIDKLRLVVPVPEESAATIQAGTPVEVSVGAVGKKVQARVSRRSHELMRSTSTMDVEIDIPNPDRVLLPGMYADVTFAIDNRQAVLTVPVQALTVHEGKSSVLVVDAAGTVAHRDVTTGTATAAYVEITTGLQEGDAVIIGDRSRLRVGQSVEPKIVTVG